MYDAGLVNEVVPSDELEHSVSALVVRIARHSPLGITGMKRLVDDGSDRPLPEALALNSQRVPSTRRVSTSPRG